MNACLSDFRVVNPTLRTFSAAEARIAQSSIRFNNLSAAELGYPENVRLLISSEGTTLAIQACDKDDPCAVPFMSGRTAEDLKGQKKWTTVSNRMLMHIIRTKLGWDSGKTPRRFYGVPWPEQYAILFDLTRASCIWMTRSAMGAIAALWVTIMTVAPFCRLMSWRICSTCLPVL